MSKVRGVRATSAVNGALDRPTDGTALLQRSGLGELLFRQDAFGWKILVLADIRNDILYLFR
jgi:hypothetical protein